MTERGLPFSRVDAFREGPFSGNPAAVVLLDRPRPARWMQAVSADMNLSETAFLLRAPGAWRLRWFTPTTEVGLCGHATLASAHFLWEEELLAPAETALFLTRGGRLAARRRGPLIVLDFPSRPPVPFSPPPALSEALGLEAREAERAGGLWIVRAGSQRELRALRPDFKALARLPAGDVAVTCRARGRADFLSRVFAPREGIDEDPVTGSAHCALGPYWSKRLGKSELRARQASARGGALTVELRGTRVLLGGRAATVLKGRLVQGR